MSTDISPNTLNLLRRPLGGVVSLNDVFEKHSTNQDEKFWELSDPDAAITEWHGNRPYSCIDMQIFLDPNLGTGGYLSVLVDDLMHETAQRLADIDTDSDYATHPDTKAELEQATKAQAIILNSAPRSAATTADGVENGRSFFLAITENNVEVYATPLVQLSELDKRHRIIALYEIANKDNPVYANSEQFRSRLISRVRRRPDCLKPIYEYPDRESLIEAKQTGKHPDVIRHDKDYDSILFVDRFGNLRLEFQDGRAVEKILATKNVGKTARIQIGSGKDALSMDIAIANSLREAPHEQLAIYTNKADPAEKIEGLRTPRYVELVIQGDVTKDSYLSAARYIQERYPDFLGAKISLTA